MKKLTALAVVALFALALAVAASGATATASWYGPGFFGNSLACNWKPGLPDTLGHSTNGVANRSLPCGTRLTVCYRHRCRRTRVIDRGPYVAGRDFDLTAGLARALGFQGVHRIFWRR